MTRIIKGIMLLVFLIISFQTKAQFADLGKLFEIEFVKDSVSQSVDSLYFNVMKIKNLTKHTIPIDLEFSLPNHWNFINKPITSTKLLPEKVKYIPFRVDLSQDTKGGVFYKVNVAITTPAIDSFVVRAANTIHVPIIRNWFVALPVSRKVLSEEDDFASYDIRLKNFGNKTENIKVFFKHGDNVTMSSFDKADGQRGYLIEPGVDTIIHYELTYEERELIFKKYEYIEMDVFNDLKSNKIPMLFEKRRSFYDNSYFRTRLNEVDISIFDAIEDPRLQASANLQMRLIGDRYLLMNFNALDLNDRANFSRNSRGRMLYHGERIEIGVGNNLTFGEDIHQINIANNVINNNFNFKYNQPFDNKGNIHAFYTRGLSRDVTTFGVGFDRKEENINSRVAIAQNMDVANRVNRSTFATQNTLVFNEENQVNAIFNIVRSNYLENRNIVESGYNHELDYSGQIGKRLFLNLGHIYFTNAYPTAQRGVSSLFGNATVAIKDTRSFLTAFYSKISKSDKVMLRDTVLLENPFSQLQYGLRYQVNVSSSWQFNFEPYIEEYRIEDRQGVNLPTEEPFHVQSLIFSAEGITRFKRGDLRFAIKQAFHGMQATPALSIRNPDFQRAIPTYGVEASIAFRRRGFSTRLNYFDGVVSPILFYNYFLTPIYPKQAGIGTSYRKRLWKNRLNTYVYGRTNYQFNRSTYTFSAGTFIEIEPIDSWFLYTYSNINYFKLVGSVLNLPVNTQVQVGVKKRFEWSPFEQRYHNLEIIFFKDENNNGWMEVDEERIPKILAELSYNTVEDERQRSVEFKNLALLTDTTGSISLKKIPGGTYKLKITADKATSRQFYAKGADRELILNSNMTYFIPLSSSFNIYGKVRIEKAKFSRLPSSIGVSNLKVIVTSESGKTYTTLTDANGNYRINLPRSEYYTITIKNPYKTIRTLRLDRKDVRVKYDETSDKKMNFAFIEKARTVKFNK